MEKLAILINGLTGSDKERGSKAYWDDGILKAIENSGIPNSSNRQSFHFVDGNRYAINYDNDYVPSVLPGSITSGILQKDRREAGRIIGKEEFYDIISKLAKDPKTGKIIEKIQIYTHSRGAAFGASYI